MITLLAIKTKAGYYKKGNPYLMVDLHQASVYPPERAESVQRIMDSLKLEGLDSCLVELQINIREWEDISAWKKEQP